MVLELRYKIGISGVINEAGRGHVKVLEADCSKSERPEVAMTHRR
jgi:hypothetical protein